MLGSSPQGDPKSFYFLRGKRSGTIQSDFLGVSRYNVENAEWEWGGGRVVCSGPDKRIGSDSTAYPREEPGRISNNGEL